MHRRSIGFFALLLALTLPSVAQAVQPAGARTFAPRFAKNDLGDITIAANTLMTCPAHCVEEGGTGPNLNNNNNNMVRVDVDGDATTFNSSRATVALPAGATVLWAGLYWGADTTAGTNGAAAGNAGANGTVKL